MISGNNIAAAITAAAIAIAEGKTADEISLLSAIFVQLGDTLTTIALQQQHLNSCLESVQTEK